MSSDYIIVGTFGAPHGVKGGIKVYSDTDPAENIATYKPWFIETKQGWQSLKVLNAKWQSKFVVALIEGYNDRDIVKALTGKSIAVKRDQLPKLDESEIYWKDLEGLTVNNKDGVLLGKVDHLLNTGANDILVVEGDKRYMIPFIRDHYVLKIDTDKKEMTVDWDPEF